MRQALFFLALIAGTLFRAASPAAAEVPAQIKLGEGGRYSDVELRVQDLQAHLYYQEGKTELGFPRAPVLKLYMDGRRVKTVEDSGNGFEWPEALVQVVEMDTSNPYPEVVFATFTGGAHCCNERRILTSSADGASWTLIEPGAIDGGVAGVEDADHDGVFELVHPDNRFFYAFASYASSVAPTKVFALKGGRLVDVSSEKRFQALHRETLRNIQPSVDNIAGQHERNGLLAGYVALKYLLGEGREAWQFMLTHYDRNSNWELNACTGGYGADGKCLRTTTYRNFPAALKAFLQRTGYMR